MNIAYPLQIAYNGRTALHDYEQHIYDMILQVLFTSPGERVNMPTFGAGVAQLVFAPNSPEYAFTYQTLIQASLQQWLGSLIQVQSLQAVSQDSTLQVTLQYIISATQQQQVQQFNLAF